MKRIMVFLTLLLVPFTFLFAEFPITITQRPSALLKLQILVGNWTGTSTTPATQWDKKSISPLKAEFKWILKKCHLRAVFHYTVEEIPYKSRTFWSYDQHTKQYHIHWIDNHSSISTMFKGAFTDSKTLILNATRMMGKRVVKEKLKLIFISEDKWQLTSESNVHGNYAVGGILNAVRCK